MTWLREWLAQAAWLVTAPLWMAGTTKPIKKSSGSRASRSKSARPAAKPKSPAPKPARRAVKPARPVKPAKTTPSAKPAGHPASRRSPMPEQKPKTAPPSKSAAPSTPAAKPIPPFGRALLLAPGNYVDTTHPRFRWLSVGGATRYEVAWSEKPDLSNQQSVISAATETAVPDEFPLQVGSVYYWRVRGGNNSGWGPWSNTASFQVLEAPPTA